MFKDDISAAIDAQANEKPKDLGLLRRVLPALPHEDGFATIVTGVRRCGKSTLLDQWAAQTAQRVVNIHFDDLRLMDFTPDDFVLLGTIISDRKAEAVILDEIQDIDGWERFVAGLLLHHLSVFVTGSNAKMLSRELGTKLTGRHLDLRLSPFDYREFLAYTKQAATAESLDAYLGIGGFPAYVKTRNRQILTDLFNDILYRDVVVRYGIVNTASIRQLAGYLLTHVGTRFAPSRLTSAIHVQAAKTVLEYCDHLTECCLIDRVEKYAESPKARMLAQKKVYACDTGLIGVLECGTDRNLGHKLENVVFNHLKQRGGEITYFLDSSERECDFIHQSETGTCEAVQVCWNLTVDNRRREIDGLVSALKYFGLKEGTLVTRTQQDVALSDGCRIKIVPAFKYLVDLGLP